MRFLVLFILLPLCSLRMEAQQRILFIGNSLSYSNNMPALLVELAASNGQKLEADCLCFPNYGLEDHVNDPSTKKRILTGKYDWVIFQQGPSSQPYGQSSLIQYGDSITMWSKSSGANPALMMVWTSVKWAHTWPLVIQNHATAASETNIQLIQVGTFWKRYLDKYPTHNLYAPDGFHPSHFGSQFAAFIVYNSIETNREVIAFPDSWAFSKNRKNRLFKLLSN